MPQSVLAIDDSPAVHEYLAVQLDSEGLTVHHALDGIEGIRKARELQPDVILLDVAMPTLTGFAICQRLKSDPATAHLQVIFLSSVSTLQAKIQGFDLGAIDYVLKPFEPAELRARVRAALRTKRYQDLLSERAQIDALTGLKNRAYFEQRLSEELAAAHRYGRNISLIILDLDHFKSINDFHGHPFGDHVLSSAAETLVDCLRTTDAPCRFGGEEFAIILSETRLHSALAVASRIQAALGRMRLLCEGTPVSVTASIGVAASDQFADLRRLSRDELLVAADAALYEAKRQGRNRVCSAPAQG